LIYAARNTYTSHIATAAERALHVGWATVIFIFRKMLFFFFLIFLFPLRVSRSPSRRRRRRTGLSFQTVIIAPGRMLGRIFRKPQFLDIVQSVRIKI